MIESTELARDWGNRWGGYVSRMREEVRVKSRTRGMEMMN